MRTVLVGLALLALTSCAPAQTRAVQVGEKVYTVEVATTEDDQRQGLAGRPEVEPGTGMLFLLPSRSTQQVWGAGMLVAVDVVWIAGGRSRPSTSSSPAQPGTRAHARDSPPRAPSTRC